MNASNICRLLFACAALAAFGIGAQESAGQGIRRGVRDVGHATRNVATKVGHGAKEAGTGIGHGAKKAGVAVGHGARDVGVAIGHGAKEGWDATRDATKKVFGKGN